MDELINLFQNEWTTQNLVYSFVLLNISESTLATSCDVCIEGSDANILNTKVSFSFGKCCASLINGNKIICWPLLIPFR